MRCLTLADELRKTGATVIFITFNLQEDWAALISGRGFLLGHLPSKERDKICAEPTDLSSPVWRLDALNTQKILEGFGRPDWLIVDHYALDAKWESVLRPHVGKIMVIDDLADREHDCDLLLDSNFYEDSERRYEALVPPSCARLLGPKYALLRPEFRRLREVSSIQSKQGFRILISFGGSDPTGETLKVLTAIAASGLKGTQFDVVVGSWNRERSAIEQLCAQIPGANYLFNVDDMASLMANAALYVGAGGTTTWERCCMKLPGIVIAVAANQISCSIALAERGAQVYLGESAEVSGQDVLEAINFLRRNACLLNATSHSCAEIVDGRGVLRVMHHMSHGNVTLRHATPADSKTMFDWRNSAEVRRNSFNPEPIQWQDHANWYAAALLDPGKVILIGMLNATAVGVLRYDLRDSKCIVSIYLSPESMGKGIGAHLLSAGTEWMAKHFSHITEFEAGILPKNVASIRVFERAGFDLDKLIFKRSQNNVE